MKPLGSLIFSALLMGLIAGCSTAPSSPPPDPSQSLPPENGYEDKSKQYPGDPEGGAALDRLGGAYGNDLDGPGSRGADRGTWANMADERRVHFALNSSMLDETAMQLLQNNIGWLSRQRGVITIEGHCDERGTREYNLALGQQRADAVVRYLVSQGIDPTQLQAISYGKERPLIFGHTQSIWSKNRRAEIVVNPN